METSSLPSRTRVSAGFSVVAIRLSPLSVVLIRILADLGSLPNTCSPEILHPGQLLLELLNILKIAVDRGESTVRNRVEPAQRRQRLLADRVRRHLLADAVSQPRLDGRGGALDLLQRQRALGAGAHQAGHQLAAVERLP